jgi:putative hydrolase of HD superfamily
MNSAELESSLAFLREAERLKSTLRSTHTSTGRTESTAEHSWRLGLMSMVFQSEYPDLDMAKVLKLCIIHDLGEALNGDIPAVLQQQSHPKSDQERSDLMQLMNGLPQPVFAEFLTLWEDYEFATSPEARLVKGMDKLETILQHNQGANPPDFDYEFNLRYGQKYMEAHPLLGQIRSLLDADTEQRRRLSASAG